LYNRSDINDYYVYAQSVTDRGICVAGALNGVGLVTSGLVWQWNDVYYSVDKNAGITTTWTPMATGATITTTWTIADGGIWGIY